MKISQKIVFALIFIGNVLSVDAQSQYCSFDGIWKSSDYPGCLVCSDVSGMTSINQFFIQILANEKGEISFEGALDCPDGELEILLFDENGILDPDIIFITGSRILRKKIKNLIPRKFYSLRFQNRIGQHCNLDFFVKTTFDDSWDAPRVIGSMTAHSPQLTGLCSPTELEFSVQPVSDTDLYVWSFPSFLTPVSIDKTTAKLKIKRGESGTGVVTVSPYRGCKTSGASPPLAVSSIGEIKALDEEFRVCSDLLPVEYKGVVFPDFQSRKVWSTTKDGCDSSIVYRPIRYDLLVDVVEECIGDSAYFEYDGRDHAVPGSYVDFFVTNQLLCAREYELILHDRILKAPEVSCVSDTFLNAVSFNWEKIPSAKGYWVIVNGDTISSQAYTGVIIPSTTSGETLEIKIQPYNFRNCVFEPGFATCFAPELTNLKDEYSEVTIHVFPNPSTGIFQISSFFKIEKTEVFDFSGRRILVEKGSEIDLTNYAEGIYVFKIYTEKGVGVKRVFKN